MLTRPDRFGMGGICGRQQKLDMDQITNLLEAQASKLPMERRLLLMGYGTLRDHHEKTHALMSRLKIGH